MRAEPPGDGVSLARLTSRIPVLTALADGVFGHGDADIQLDRRNGRELLRSLGG